MSVYYIDGEYVPAENATLPADDLAILRGYGAFDFLRTYGGRPFRLERNLQRLRRSAALIGLEYPWTDEEIAAIVYETLARSGHDESHIRLVVTGGSSPDNITPQGRPRLMVMVTQLQPPPAWWYEDGVKVVTFSTERYVPGAKSINYIPAIMALREARQQQAIEALYVDSEGHVREGTTTNVFACCGGRLVTPGADILPGITRETVLELCTGVYEIDIRDIPREELLAADEVFITAANKQIVPVVQVDETIIGDGRPGPRTRRVMALFREETERAAAREIPSSR